MLPSHVVTAPFLDAFRARLGRQTWPWLFTIVFTTRAYAKAVLGVLILSGRLSVCPSITRVDCDKIKWCTADILIPHERADTLLLWHQQWFVCDAPFPLKSALICMYVCIKIYVRAGSLQHRLSRGAMINCRLYRTFQSLNVSRTETVISSCRELSVVVSSTVLGQSTRNFVS